MKPETTITLTNDPAWPWSETPYGLWILVGVGVLLAVLTVWTYRGQQRAGTRRVAVILGLRLLALLLACLTILRPSLAFRDESQTPSVLLVLLDASASMTIQDEHDNQSRWEALQRLMKSSGPLFKELEKERNVTLIVYRFAGDAQPWDDAALPDGKRTDLGRALHSLYELHRQEKNLRGLIVLGDGADNGNSHTARPLAEAARWRNLPCPIYTFALGKPTTADAQNDIVVKNIVADPSPVPVKGKLNIKVEVDAFGFNDVEVDVHLLVDEGSGESKPVRSLKEKLTQAQGNILALSLDAPAKPGEIKVTVKIDPKPGEVSVVNNEITTYVSVTKEGITVLLVDKLRYPEPQGIVDALNPDPRIRVYPAWLRSDKPGGQDLFQFEKQRYDVIILGDVSVPRLLAASPNALQEIHDLVADKGAGLLMMGGNQTLGNGGWNAANVERADPKTREKRAIRFVDMLPVDLDRGEQVTDSVKLEPTAEGLDHFVMKLAETREANADLWRRLPALKGMSRLGKKKATATTLATWSGQEDPVIAGQRYGEGRVLAFGGDTTYLWRNLGWPEPKEGIAAHGRFWRQLVYWLAQQDKLEGSIWIKPDVRRVAVGDSVPFAVGARGKGGVELDTTGGKASFKVRVVGPFPKKDSSAVTVAPDVDGKLRGVYYPTQPGEYRFEVEGKATDTDGSPVAGNAAVRFLVYQDESELARRSADHQFLQQLAHAGGGSAHLGQELPDFLRKLKKEPLLQSLPRVELAPDWRSQELSPFMVALLLVFTAVLCLEWFFRRRWGLV